MKTHVEFRTNIFPPYDGEEDEINPGRWGKKVAEYLQIKLRDCGIQSDDIYSENWGWAIPVKNERFPIFIGCGSYEELEGGFFIFIEPSKPIFLNSLKRLIPYQM